MTRNLKEKWPNASNNSSFRTYLNRFSSFPLFFCLGAHKRKSKDTLLYHVSTFINVSSSVLSLYECVALFLFPFYTMLPNSSGDQPSANHIPQNHVPLFPALIEKCKSPTEALVTSRQTLASHSSAQTSPPGYLQITKCEIRIHKALALIECVCRIQNNTFNLLHQDRHSQD